MSEPAAGFTSASEVFKNMPPPPPGPSLSLETTPTAQPTIGTSHRNASNAHLPVETPPGETESAEAGPSKPVNKPVNVPAGNKRSIIVNACQRGNPLLNGIKGIGWEYGDIVPDYQVGQNTCVLYLSLKYHRLHPEYLHNRIERLRGMYLLRVLLLICDISEHQEPIREITKICLINDMTVMTAWNVQEAANYIMTYKAFEHKPPDMLKERVQKDYPSQLQNALTSVKGVNKTDVITLSTNFGSFKKLAHASSEQLSLCPGLGDVKVRRLMEAFNLPFRPGAGSSKEKDQKKTSDFFTKNGKGKGRAGTTWELSENEEPAANKDNDKKEGLELNGTLMWKDPLGSDSDEADEEPVVRRAKV
ncbi:hypothetical protein FFLO_01065 [Filobasidium floriforme]|uniref:DNA excision repair protein ERCC-1 n=1 Tax=Filobasidium floriforme TaxID=5210 RepID=A0A8K0NT00_9TREE|nr:hypothetical protein FFLO_01065 [Filobasidium floriforme]